MKQRILSAVLIAVVCCTSLASCSSEKMISDSATSSTAESISTISSESVADSIVQDSASSAVQSEPKEVSVEEKITAEENKTTFSAEELKAAQEKFQAVFDQMKIGELYEGQYSGCRRYTIVSDYDGDGTLEAFGFVGIESDWQPAPYWECISIYYIASDYTITPLAGKDSGYDSVNGVILCPEPNYTDDFSNCVYTSGKEHFLAWEVAYWEGDWFALILGVHDGKPVLSYPGESFFVNDSGQFATFDDDYHEVLLQLKDGEMIRQSS